MGPVTKLNRMPLDSQAHRMPQGPLSGPSTIERQGQRVQAAVERYRSCLDVCASPRVRLRR